MVRVLPDLRQNFQTQIWALVPDLVPRGQADFEGVPSVGRTEWNQIRQSACHKPVKSSLHCPSEDSHLFSKSASVISAALREISNSPAVEFNVVPFYSTVNTQHLAEPKAYLELSQNVSVRSSGQSQ